MKSFNLNICSLVLLALLPVAPLFIPWHRNPVPSFHSEWLAVMFGLCAWIIASPALWQQKRLSIPRIALLPLAFMAFIGVQAQLLPIVTFQHAQIGMLYLLWAALLMMLVRLLVEKTSHEQVSRGIAIGLVTAAVCCTLIELAFRLKGIFDWWGGAGQANNYGDLLALGLASSLYLSAPHKSGRQILLLAAALVIVLGLSLTPSRSVWLYWLALLAISFFWQRGLLKSLLTSFGIYLLLQAVWTFHPLVASNPEVAATSAEKLYQSVGGSAVRLHIWQIAWQLFTESPWLGQGFGQFDWGYFHAAQHIPELPNRVEHAHNLILHILAELGLFPVLGLLGLFAVWLKGIMTAITEQPLNGDSHGRAFYVWLLMLLAVLGIHSLLEYPLWYAPFLGIAAIMLALGENRHWQLRLQSIGVIVLSLLITVGITIASVHEWHYLKIETALAGHSTNPTQVLKDSQQAAAQAPLLTPYVAVVFSLSGDLGNEKMRETLTLLNEASYHFLPAATLAYQKAALQALNGFQTEAQHTLKLALLAYPDWAKNFMDSLSILNAQDRQKTDFLKNMAEAKLQKLN